MLRKEWNTRWAAILVNQTYLALMSKSALGLVYQGTTLALGLTAFYPISNFLNPKLSIVKRIILSLSLLLSLFFLSFGLSDSWFWMCSQPAYLWATLISIWMVASLFKDKSGLLVYPFIVVAHIYVGGSSEIVAICILLVELSMLIFGNRIPLINRKLLILGLLGLSSSLLFSLTGEGIETRYAFLAPPGIIDGSVIALKSYLKTIVFGIGPKLPLIGLTIVVLLAISPHQKTQPFIDWKIPFGIADGVLICTMIITAFTLGDIGPNRALIHVSAMALIMVILAIPLIRLPFLPEQGLQTTTILLCVIVTGYLAFLLVNDLPKEVLYSNALKERQTSIESQIAKGDKEIRLAPFPASKFLYRAEISPDSNSENNRQLSTIYGDDIQFILIVPE